MGESHWSIWIWMDFHGSKLMDFLGEIDGFDGILMKNHRKKGINHNKEGEFGQNLEHCKNN